MLLHASNVHQEARSHLLAVIKVDITSAFKAPYESKEERKEECFSSVTLLQSQNDKAIRFCDLPFKKFFERVNLWSYGIEAVCST